MRLLYIYNACTFSSGSESEALAVTGQHGKDVDGLFEKVSFQTAFEGVEKSRSAGMKALKLPPFNEDKDDLDAYLIRFELCERYDATLQTFVGSGHSSRSSVITDGPNGSSAGITLMTVSTTLIQPVSSSASLCSRSNDHGVS